MNTPYAKHWRAMFVATLQAAGCPEVDERVQEGDNGFVYIDGAFSANIERVDVHKHVHSFTNAPTRIIKMKGWIVGAGPFGYERDEPIVWEEESHDLAQLLTDLATRIVRARLDVELEKIGITMMLEQDAMLEARLEMVEDVDGNWEE